MGTPCIFPGCEERSLTCSTLQQVSKGPLPVWLGLYQKENGQDENATWVWMDDQPAGYFNWGDGEPNNDDGFGGQEDCVNMYENSGYWNDAYCNNQYGYVCEVFKSKKMTPMVKRNCGYTI